MVQERAGVAQRVRVAESDWRSLAARTIELVAKPAFVLDAAGTLVLLNGRRFVPRGGNWGFPESMLRYRGREYDVAVRYHKHLNFNMIQGWQLSFWKNPRTWF